jgi:hypothetical protein
MKKIFITTIVFILFSSFTIGQDMGAPLTSGSTMKGYYSFGWNMTAPLGDFNDWVDEWGLVGGVFGGRTIVNNKILVGGDIGWQRVSAIYEDEMYQDPEKGVALTATNYRFTYMIPFQGVIGYQMSPDKLFSPYVSLGIGGDYMEHHLVIQEYDIYKYRWDFSLTPEIGAIVKFGNYSNWGAIAAFNYKWTTNQIEFGNTSSKDLNMLNIKFGLAYLIY